MNARRTFLLAGLALTLSAALPASADDLTQLRASIASRETFQRYGIDRPAFLQSLTLKVGKDAQGRNILEVRSPDAITEPFLTLLVEVTWPRGRLVRIPLATRTDPSTWTELVAESDEAVLRSVACKANRLVVSELVDTFARIRVLDLDGNEVAVG